MYGTGSILHPNCEVKQSASGKVVIVDEYIVCLRQAMNEIIHQSEVVIRNRSLSGFAGLRFERSLQTNPQRREQFL